MAQLEHLRTLPVVAAGMARGDLSIHGWVYDIAHAEIETFDAERGCFVKLDPSAGKVPDATPHVRFATMAAA
ncbi:hypothetical protein GCM10010981_47400 [Dyella nitratireducens]|uniref:Carbonic anhydrase n=1 Tax=Dyella nitratireducens TaxID=1849580 RepID=A0ABQ1GYI3_9GAMM|nr:hypothetical protein GCM10010981_47400 [Dyella nitratireducens]GLQ41569.1 hypothetical protein GCM10007902_14190 [Dyella nitratireducens]